MVATAVAPGEAEDTFPKLLIRNARIFAAKPAMREKDLGIWQAWTWAQVLDEVRAFAIGLDKLGVERGARMAIVGDNRPRLYWAICAAQSLGVIPVPVYQDSVAQEMGYVLDHAGVSCVVAENQEQVDKILEIREGCHDIRHVIYDNPRGLENYHANGLVSFEAVQALGRKALAEDGSAQSRWRDEVARGSGSDIAIILYTSGTTGRPKGVVLSVANVLDSARVANAFDKLTAAEEVIAYLPMAWVGDHIFSYAQSYASGYCVNCPESRETVVEDRREIGTTYAFAPPRVYETLITLTMVRMEDAGALKRRMFHFFLGIARKYGEKILNRQPVPLSGRLLYRLGDLLVYAPLRNRFGLSKIRVAYTAGEAIGPEIFRFYRALGMNLKQLYGQTEASVYVTAQPDGEIHADTVGRPTPGVEIRIASDGEVLYRSPGVFREYYRNPEATEQTKTRDGWVRSGDAGFLDERGHLKIIDRAKDVGRLRNGALFPPKYIENKLKFYPDIKEAVAFGDQRDFVTVMLNIDLTAVGSWAERNDVVYGSYQELAGHPRVYDMMQGLVDEVNRSLAAEAAMAGAQISRFLVLPKELDADDGELTRTQKVRRGFIAERYAPLVKALYEGAAEAEISTEVTFDDGRKGMLSARIAIRDVTTCPTAPAIRKEAAE